MQNDILKLENNYLLPLDQFNTHVIEYKYTQVHNHTFWEIFYVLNGTAMHTVNGTPAQLTVLDAVFLRPDRDWHTFTQIDDCRFLHRDLLVGDELFRSLCNVLSPTLYETLLSTADPFQLKLTSEQLLYFESSLSKLTCLENDRLSCPALYVSVLTALLAAVSEALALQSKSQSSSWLERLKNILNTPEHFTIPLHQLLDTHLTYNLSYVCKVFKENTGMTMTEYFNRAKLNYAKSLLLSTDHTVLDISLSVGFNNLSHFHHAFKKQFGISPSAYRKQFR